MDTNDKLKQGVDIDKLVKEHPEDPQRGQGYNSARGEIPDAEHPADHNIKNNLGPQQKRRKLGKVAPPQTQAGYVPSHRKDHKAA